MPAVIHNDLLMYKGSNLFRQRLLLSTLSGRTIKIEEIRSTHEDPGLKEYEVNLIRLLDKITNGSRVELSESGTSLYFQPGILIGGQITHNCSTQRGIGKVLLYFIYLISFELNMKKKKKIELPYLSARPLKLYLVPKLERKYCVFINTFCVKKLLLNV